ncbi:hepatoma-derived growth factor-related protein 2-like isoform X2 [Ptychodera flava]|uniref:hepatoma-derived growth factor-related protein 2-like isoform X2 n=1 Tax=Ptychodera flava TaxID=63121 RepID=UPI003969BD80
MSERFKLDAQKMIAAHQTRGRPTSPESSSNWDSSEADEEEEEEGPKIEETTSSDTDDDRGSVKRSPINMKPIPTPASRANVSNNRSLKPESANKGGSRTPQGGLTPQGGRTPQGGLTPQGGRTPKASPSLSLKNSLRPGVNMFVDRSRHNSDDDSDSYANSVPKQRTSKHNEMPPYDFRGVVNGDRDVGRDIQPPGKSRKGNSYDPGFRKTSSPEVEDDFSWADSDAEARTLRALRAEMDKTSPKAKAMSSAGPSKSYPAGLSAVELREKQKQEKEKNKSMSQQQLVVASPPTNLNVSGGLSNPAFQDEFVNADTEDRRSFAYSENEGYIYYFEHGNRRYYDGRGAMSDAYMADIADKSAKYVRRGLQEFFHALRIILEAILLLVLETARFLFQNIFQFFLKELFIVVGDHFLRPVLSSLYNHVMQPSVVFLYNCGYGLKRVLFPCIEILRDIMNVLAIPLRAFRLFELNWRVPSDVGVHQYAQIQQV